MELLRIRKETHNSQNSLFQIAHVIKAWAIFLTFSTEMRNN